MSFNSVSSMNPAALAVNNSSVLNNIDNNNQNRVSWLRGDVPLSQTTVMETPNRVSWLRGDVPPSQTAVRETPKAFYFGGIQNGYQHGRGVCVDKLANTLIVSDFINGYPNGLSFECSKT